MSKEIEEINNMAKKSIEMHRRRRSIVFIEAAVGELVSCHSIKEAKEILESYVDYLEEFG